MFYGCKNFNQNIFNWDVSNVTDMNRMFQDSKFIGNISNWNVSNVTDKQNMFYNCHIKEEYEPKFKK